MKILNISIDTIVIKIDGDNETPEVNDKKESVQAEQGTPVSADEGVKIMTLQDFLEQRNAVIEDLVRRRRENGVFTDDEIEVANMISTRRGIK